MKPSPFRVVGDAQALSFCIAKLRHDSLSRKIDRPCPPKSYAAPLLKHGCAELASAQHTIPAKRVFIPPVMLRSSTEVYPGRPHGRSCQPGSGQRRNSLCFQRSQSENNETQNETQNRGADCLPLARTHMVRAFSLTARSACRAVQKNTTVPPSRTAADMIMPPSMRSQCKHRTPSSGATKPTRPITML